MTTPAKGLTPADVALFERIVPGNTSHINFMDIRVSHDDLGRLLAAARAEEQEQAYRRGWNDREADFMVRMDAIAPAALTAALAEGEKPAAGGGASEAAKVRHCGDLKCFKAQRCMNRDHCGVRAFSPKITREWFEKRAALEGDLEIGAGGLGDFVSTPPTAGLRLDEMATIVRALKRTAGALRLSVGAGRIPETAPITFTNEFAHLGGGTFGGILDEADRALALTLISDDDPTAGGWKPDREDLKFAIADGFSNGNEQYAQASEAQRQRYDMAADAILSLPPTQAAEAWKPVSQWPERDELIIAATDDGRRMMWKPSILKGAMQGAPDHLTFPATFWMYLTDLPSLPSTLEGGGN